MECEECPRSAITRAGGILMLGGSLFVLIGRGRSYRSIVRMQGSRDEVIARVENLLICKAAFEKALFVYPNEHLEMLARG